MRLQLFVLAYNLGNFLRQAVLPQAVRHWTLTTLREKLIKIGAKVARHSGKIVFQMAEVAVPRELFRAILEGIQRLRLATVLSGERKRLNNRRGILETTEEVSRIREKMGVGSQKWHRNGPVPENNRNGLEKSSCEPVEQEENHEKGPRGSWARNHMGNPSQYE